MTWGPVVIVSELFDISMHQGVTMPHVCLSFLANDLPVPSVDSKFGFSSSP